MLRQSDIAAALRASILRSSKGFQYLHTRDFVSALRQHGLSPSSLYQMIHSESLYGVVRAGIAVGIMPSLYTTFLNDEDLHVAPLRQPTCKRKIALMCDVDVEAVITCRDAPSLYEIPRVLHAEGLDAYVVRRLGVVGGAEQMVAQLGIAVGTQVMITVQQAAGTNDAASYSHAYLVGGLAAVIGMVAAAFVHPTVGRSALAKLHRQPTSALADAA